MINIFKRKKRGTDDFSPTETTFDQLIKGNRRLFFIVIIEFLIILYAIGGLKKPPVVLRLYGNGNQDIVKNYQEENQVLPQDLPVFISSFIRRINLSDSYHLKERLSLGISMMSKQLQSDYLNNVLTEENLKSIKELEWETETRLGKPKFSRKADYILCELIFVRDIVDTINSKTFSQTYRGEIKLELVKRSEEYPFGLAVREFNYDKLETNTN